jgi:tetratricopeptide (TPR) repeat protein
MQSRLMPSLLLLVLSSAAHAQNRVACDAKWLSLHQPNSEYQAYMAECAKPEHDPETAWQTCTENDYTNVNQKIISCSTFIDSGQGPNSRRVAALIARGHAYLRTADPARQAMADFNEAIRLDPKNSLAYSGRGDAWAPDTGHRIGDYSTALQLDPKNAGAYFGLGMVRKFGNAPGDKDQAITDFSRAIQFDPKNAMAYSMRGDLYLQKKEFDLAIADSTMAVQLLPRCLDCYRTRGSAYYAKGDYDRAIADVSEEIRLKTTPSWYEHLRRANAYAAKGDSDHAVADYKEAMRIDAAMVRSMTDKGDFKLNATLVKALNN